MVKTEYPYNGDERLIRTYSTNSKKALKQVETNRVYTEAIDIYPCRYTYVECDAPTEDY